MSKQDVRDADNVPEVATPRQQRKRAALPAWTRHTLVAMLGILLAFATFYLLQELGY